MPLVFACVAPHGDVIPDAAGNTRSPATTAAMEELGRRAEAARPETVIVVTPHGVRADGALTLSLSERAAGGVDTAATPDDPPHPIQIDLTVDQSLAHALHTAAAARGIPTVAIHYGATTGPADCYPLDWGGVVPLWFLGARFATPPRVVVVVPSRLLPLTSLTSFGEVIAEIVAESSQRVALVASADQAHAHAADGPYGFDPAAARFDEWMADIIRTGDLARLEHPDPALIEAAKPDALWQTLILAGALRRIPMRGELLSYERPTYYGMLCAAYMPV